MPLGALVTVDHSAGAGAQAGAVGEGGELGAVDVGKLVLHHGDIGNIGLVRLVGSHLGGTGADTELDAADVGVAVDLGDLQADGLDIARRLCQDHFLGPAAALGPIGGCNHIAPGDILVFTVILGGNIDIQGLDVAVAIVHIEAELIHGLVLIENDVVVVVGGQSAHAACLNAFRYGFAGVLIAGIVGVPVGADVAVHGSAGPGVQAGAVGVTGHLLGSQVGVFHSGNIGLVGTLLGGTHADIDLGATDVVAAVHIIDLDHLNADGLDIVLDLVQRQVSTAGAAEQGPVGGTDHFAPIKLRALGVLLRGNIHLNAQDLGIGIIVGVEAHLVDGHCLIQNDVDVVVCGQVAAAVTLDHGILGLLVAGIVGVPLGIQIAIDNVHGAGAHAGAFGVGGELGAVDVGELILNHGSLGSLGMNADLGATDVIGRAAGDFLDFQTDGLDIGLDGIQLQLPVTGTGVVPPAGGDHAAPIQGLALFVFLRGHIDIQQADLGIGSVDEVEAQHIHIHGLSQHNVVIVITGQSAAAVFHQRIIGHLGILVIGMPLVAVNHNTVHRAGGGAIGEFAVGITRQLVRGKPFEPVCRGDHWGHRQAGQDHDQGKQAR